MVKVDENSINNPLLKPSIKEFSFKAKPDQVKGIDIPFYISGEISGTVYEFVGGERREAGGIQVIIESDKNELIKIRTFGDGSFYYFGIKPGNYIIYIDPKYTREKESFPPEYSIKIETGENNNFISDLIFEIK